MPRSPSPTGSLIGPSRSNSVARQHEKKPYERPSNGNVSSGNNQNANEQQAGLLGGLKRSLSRWFSASPAPAEVDANSTHRTSNSDERKMSTSTSLESSKRQAPRMSPERAGTPSKKQRVTSPQRFEVQGRAVESFNVREYGSSRLPTQRQDRERVPNYARPFGTTESGSSSTSMTRSRTTGGGYNDPPVSLLAGSPARTSLKPSSSSSGMRRSETMTLNLDREKNVPASPASRSFRSPLYTSTSTSTMSRSSTLGSIASPSGRMSSPFRGQQEAAERVARQRAMREGSSVPASPSRSGLRSQSRMDVEPTNNRTRESASPTPRAGSPRRSMSTMKDMSVVPPSPSRGAVRSSRLRYSIRPMYDDEEDQQEVLMDAPEEQDDGMEVSPERERQGSRYRRGTSGRMSVDPVTSPVDQNSQAEMLLQQLAEMRRSSRHVNIQAGLPSSVQAPPTPNSLSTRQMRKRMAVRVPKASSAAEEALRLSTTGSLSEGPARLRGTRRAKELEGEKGKGSVMQRPYARKPSGYSRPKSEETDEGQDKEEVVASEEEPDKGDAATDKPFTFSMANAPTKISGPMNITFSPSATKIVRTGTGSNLRAQKAVTRRTHEPAAGASRKTESTRTNQFAIPDDDDDDEDDDEMNDDIDDFPASRNRQPSQSPQPVSIPAPVRSPSPRKKKDVDVTAVRKVRGFLDAAGVNRPRASSPLAAAPLNASALTKTAPMQSKPSLNLGSSSASTPVPDFFAMPKKPAESAVPTAGKGMAGIGLGRPGASTPAPSFAFTAPSPTSSPTVNTVRAEPVKPTPAFSFESSASTTPAKPPPFVFSAPAAATNTAKMPDFFAKPAASTAEPKAAAPTPAAGASPSFFGNPASSVTPAPPATSGFNFSAPKPLSLFGSSPAASTADNASTTPAPASSLLPSTQDKPADKPAAAPLFTFGTSQPAASAATPTGGLFGSNKPANSSTNPLFGGSKSTTPAAAAASTPFAFGSSSTKPSSSLTFGSSSDAATPAPSSPFAFGSSAPKEQAKASAPTNLFGSSSTASTTPAAAPPSNLFGAAASKPSTPSAAPGGFNFGTTPSASTPAPAFSFGSTETKSSPSPAPFSFGSNTPTSTPFGAAAASPASSNNMFGGAAPASGGMFGSASNAPASANSTPSFGGFGQAAPASPFGQPAAAAPTPATGFGGFGAPSQPAPPAPGGMFGSTSSGFGASPAPQPGMFGSTPGTPGTPGTANTGFSFNVGGAGPAFPAGDTSRQPSPAFSVGAGDAPGGRKIRKLPTTRKK